MKKIAFLFIFSLFTFAFSFAQQQLEPTAVATNKEPYRTLGLNFDPQYVQPVTEWTHAEEGEGVVWRAEYKIPFGWIDREQFLCIERVSGSFAVRVNGTEVGYSQLGSSPAEFDITRPSKEGLNVLEIVVYKQFAASAIENNRPVPIEPAIEGEMCILSQPALRVRDFVTQTRVENASGLMELGVVMRSHKLNRQSCTVFYELHGPDGEVVAGDKKDFATEMRGEDTVRFFANIRDVKPWNNLSPNLYTLVIKTVSGGRVRETVSYPMIGFRDAILAGGPTPDGGVYYSSEDIKECVAADKIFYAECAAEGVYVRPQADIDTHLAGDDRKKGGNPSNDPRWLGAYLDRTWAMWYGARNCPAVVEFSLAGDAANGYCLYETYLALKALDKTRPVRYPRGGEWNNDF